MSDLLLIRNQPEPYMKTNFTLSFLKNLSLFSTLAIILGVAQSCSVAENAHTGEVKKNRSSGKNRDVKIYPDMLKKVMHIKNLENSEVDFFVFDNEGSIMVHYKMNEYEHKKIDGLERGTYVYQVFKKDEMSESGKIIIK